MMMIQNDSNIHLVTTQKMISLGIFLFLLGTKIGWVSANQSDNKHGPFKIGIREQIDQSPVLIPELGSPPYGPNFVHQGKNYFFGNPFPMLPGHAPVETVETKIKEVYKDGAIKSNPVAKENPVFKNKVTNFNAKGLIQNLPIPDITLNIKPIPYFPSIPINLVNSQLLSQLTRPLQSLNIPGLQLLKSPKTPNVPILIEGPLRTSGGYVISEVNVPVKRIPPPPELPPLEELFKPVIVAERKVVMIPTPLDTPELLRAALPPSVFIAGKTCEPTLCAQNIILERVLPNIVREESKMVEMISISAFKRVITSFKPFVKKVNDTF